MIVISALLGVLPNDPPTGTTAGVWYAKALVLEALALAHAGTADYNS